MSELQSNAQAVPNLLEPITRELGGTELGTALWNFVQQLDAPLSLRDRGMQKDQVDQVVESALLAPDWNPHVVTTAGRQTLLHNNTKRALINSFKE